MLVKFMNDGVVVPKESEYFQEMGENGDIIDFNQTDMFLEDRIGLKTLFDNKKIWFRQIDDHGHVSFGEEEVIFEFIPFLYDKYIP